MRLRQWLKYVDVMNKIVIWAEDDEPLYEGYITDIPWTIVNMKIGFQNKEENKGEDPIHIWAKGENDAAFVVNVCDG